MFPAVSLWADMRSESSVFDPLKVAPWYFSVEEALASDEPVLKLDLSGQELTELPPELFGLRTIRVLLLNGNALTSLPDEMTQLSDLSELEVSGNLLENFPGVILSLYGLNELELNDNRIAEIPEEISVLQDLTELELRANRLAKLPASLVEMRRLEEIKVDHNRIARMDPGIFKLPRLIELTIAHNQLTDFDVDFTGNRSLRELDIAHNRIEHLPDGVFHLPLDTCFLWQPAMGRLRGDQYRWLLLRPYNDGDEFALAPAESGNAEDARYYLSHLEEVAADSGMLRQAEVALLAAKVYRLLRESDAAEDAATMALSRLKACLEQDDIDFRTESRAELEEMRSRAQALLALAEAEVLRGRFSWMFRACLLGCVVGLSAILGTVLISRRRLQRAHQLMAAQKSTIEDQARRLASANATKDRILSIVGHDLRNPFAAISGLAETLRSESRWDGACRESKYPRLIAAAAREAGALLENLLSWCRSREGLLQLNPEFLEMAPLVNTVLELYGPNLESKHLRVETDLEAELMIFADRQMLLTVLRNLIGNAIKFTPEAGVIQLRAFSTSEDVRIEIEDSGIGMSHSEVDSLFSGAGSMTKQGTAGEKGAGLGMYLCREFISLNDGSMEIRSVPGEGSVFSVSLPLCGMAVRRSRNLAAMARSVV